MLASIDYANRIRLITGAAAALAGEDKAASRWKCSTSRAVRRRRRSRSLLINDMLWKAAPRRSARAPEPSPARNLCSLSLARCDSGPDHEP